MKILLINKFLFPKGGDVIVTPVTGGLLASGRLRQGGWRMGETGNARKRAGVPVHSRSVRGARGNGKREGQEGAGD